MKLRRPKSSKSSRVSRRRLHLRLPRHSLCHRLSRHRLRHHSPCRRPSRRSPCRRPRPPHLPQVVVKAILLRRKKYMSRNRQRKPRNISNIKPRRLKKRKSSLLKHLLLPHPLKSALTLSLPTNKRPTMMMSTTRWTRPAALLDSLCTLPVTSIMTCQRLNITTSALCPTTRNIPTSLPCKIGLLISAPPMISSVAKIITSSERMRDAFLNSLLQPCF